MSSPDSAGQAVPAPDRLYIGSYTPTSGGRGEGITVLERSAPGVPWQAVQVVQADDPSFLAVADGALHAASETGEGRVLSYTVSAGALVAASSASSGGSSPCHLVVDPVSGALVVANYVGGSIGVLSDDPSHPARVTRSLALPVGHGPVLERQEHPHAHQAAPTPWGTVLVSDLGTDRLVEYVVDPITLDPEQIAVHPLPSGSGPRHLAWLDDRLVVVGELDSRLHVLRRVGEKLVVDHSVEVFEGASATPGILPSHIAVDAGRVYVATRGRDTISVFSGEGDRLTFVGEAPCGGEWPRHFAITPGMLYCANQGSDTVSVLPLDPETGLPGAPIDVFSIGSPACIVVG